MTREEQKKMIEEYIKKNGVTRVAADTRGKDFLDQEFELRRKKLKVKLLREGTQENAVSNSSIKVRVREV